MLTKRKTGEPAAAKARTGAQPDLKVNGWIVYRGTTPIATAATEHEAVDAAGRYLSDPAGGLMHLRAAVGDELLPSLEAIEPGGRAGLVRSLEHLILAAEQAGDADAANALGSAAERLLEDPQSGPAGRRAFR